MKNAAKYLLTSGLMLVGTLGFVTDVQASKGVTLVMPPAEQQSYQMSKKPSQQSSEQGNISTKVSQEAIRAKKQSILNKIAHLRVGAKQDKKAKTLTHLGSKPKQIYKYSRLLDYSPHPTTEEILKDKPVSYKGKEYSFTITYHENWLENKSETVLTGINFSIKVLENGKEVRSLTTPKVNVAHNKLKKGQIIGIAEVAPFKFNIKVEDVTSTAKGVTVLIFNLELIA